MSLSKLNLLYDLLQSVVADLEHIQQRPEYEAFSPEISERTICTIVNALSNLKGIQSVIWEMMGKTSYPAEDVDAKDRQDYSSTIAHLSPESILQNQQVLTLLSVATPILTALTVAEAITAAAKLENPASDTVLREKAIKDAVHFFDLAHNAVKEHNSK